MGLMEALFGKKPVFNGRAAETVFAAAEAEGKDSSQGLWFVNRATQAMGVDNTAMDDIQAEMSEESTAKAQYENEAERVFMDAKEEADELRRQAKEAEKNGVIQSETMKRKARVAKHRVAYLAKIKDCL